MFLLQGQYSTTIPVDHMQYFIVMMLLYEMKISVYPGYQHMQHFLVVILLDEMKISVYAVSTYAVLYYCDTVV